MSKFQLSGMQRDMVKSMATLQQGDAICDFIESTVDTQVGLGQPPVVPPAPSEVEQAILKLVAKNA